MKQATYLFQHRRSSEFIRELCHMAVNYLLVMRDTDQKHEQKLNQYHPVSVVPAEVEDRITSKEVATILSERARKTTETGYFSPSTCKPFKPFENECWRRHFLELGFSVKQLREISHNVWKGMPPAAAGLAQPGIAKRPGKE